MTFTEAHDTLIKVVTVLGIIGIPSIFTMTIYCISACIKFTNSLKFISSAIKSEIRSDLFKDFDEYDQRGWCSTIEQTEWINRYKSYHNLYGENGVLDDKYDQMIRMPSSPRHNAGI